MPSTTPAVDRAPSETSDLAKAFQELAKGEKTATAMENQLTALERKIDDLLTTVSAQDQDVEVAPEPTGQQRHEPPNEGMTK